jgi:hypothetical protein
VLLNAGALWEADLGMISGAKRIWTAEKFPACWIFANKKKIE